MLIFLSALLAIAAPGRAQAEQSLTNDVQIADNGMRLALCDNFFEAAESQTIFAERELDVNRDLFWVLHNASTKNASVIFLGMTNSFDFKLFDSYGAEMPKTTKGKAMSVGPEVLTSVHGNSHGARLGGPHDSISSREFPPLKELFEFPRDGNYALEVRYWAWINAKQRFILSDPVRLRVIKKASPSGQSMAPAK